MNSLSNRRNNLRVPVRCEVELQPLNDDASASEPQRLLSLDLSVGGMQLIGDCPVPVDSEVFVAFDCKELGWGPFSCKASVMWVAPHPTNGRCRIGVKFSDVEKW
ncbi:hypothetical protein CKO12_10040 [Chromatium okenii]|uniref:PilZ domain-containing protein n=1 Tax=Chromatium okenii TaxID=61644 RepID=UPI00190483C3|nr:PilZ domain-containing protein [Chromatium okenii]MBK1642213.1 hypothetical protein [Chromatium okenii]